MLLRCVKDMVNADLQPGCRPNRLQVVHAGHGDLAPENPINEPHSLSCTAVDNCTCCFMDERLDRRLTDIDRRRLFGDPSGDCEAAFLN